MATDLKTLKKADPPQNFPAMLERWKPQIATALPSHLSADRMCRVALTCFRANPKLAECDPRSVFAAVIQSAQLGLELGMMGEAHIVPFKTTCTMIPGYAGLIKLAKQTGQVTDIYAVSVRQHDTFECTFGTDRKLTHTPKTNNGFPLPDEQRGDIIGFYAVAKFKDGSNTFELLTVEKVKKVRDESKGYQAAKKWKRDTPWDTHFEEMGKKTAIRALCKTLPKSPELQTALEIARVQDEGRGTKPIDLDTAISGDYAVIERDEDEPQNEGPTETPADTGPAAEISDFVRDGMAAAEAKNFDEAKDIARSIEKTDPEGAGRIRAAIAAHGGK